MRSSGASYLILRCGWLYSAMPGNFLTKMLGHMQSHRPLRVVDDQVGVPKCAPAERSRGGVLPRNVVICVFESMTEFETTRLHARQSFYPSGPFPMRSTLRRASLVIFLLNVCGAWYIDPGAASLLWQLIVSGIIGVGFTLRHSITRMYRRLRRRENDAQ